MMLVAGLIPIALVVQGPGRFPSGVDRITVPTRSNLPVMDIIQDLARGDKPGTAAKLASALKNKEVELDRATEECVVDAENPAETAACFNIETDAKAAVNAVASPAKVSPPMIVNKDECVVNAENEAESVLSVRLES